MARTIRKSTTLLTTLAVASLLLSGCAAASGEPAPSPAAPSHTMPDGTVMSGAEHDAHGEDAAHEEHDAHETGTTDAQGPSEAARMVCEGQVVTSAAQIFDLEASAAPSSSWDSPMFACTYDVDGAPVVLTVHDVTDAAAGQEHFDALQQTLGAEDIEGMLGLGLPSFSTGDGMVAFLRDGKTLTVDATALPDGFGDGTRTQDEAAYVMASAVLTCWVEHD
ncbi:hypothetical protein SAMN04487783_0382 [Agrococcus baldri]|uniref:DUF3558 domain-containing protein n=1 Tax=Agrococcus baldri TaxID=153730 RepID=A0AA94HKF8_9MICO|nr:hypothetical protein [Agrococcus baldri]SFR99741.1 hypothetical protein SAMN04487783_0382 [Agrococcus baldri]